MYLIVFCEFLVYFVQMARVLRGPKARDARVEHEEVRVRRAEAPDATGGVDLSRELRDLESWRSRDGAN